MGRRLGPDYGRLLVASAVSNLGDGMVMASAPLLAASLTRDPRLVAGLEIAVTLPWLCFALLGGALADRLDRRRAMWTVNALRGAAFAGLALLVAADALSLPMLYAVFFVVGVSETLYDSAAQALIPSLVDPEGLTAANGRLQAGEVIANHLLGPPLGGLLFAAAAAAPFAIDAVSFFVSALLIWRIAGGRRAPAGADAGPPTTLRGDIAEGVRYLFGHPVLRVLAVALGCWNLLEYMMVGTLVLLVQNRLGLGEVGFGLVLAAASLGGLAATVTTERVVRTFGEAGTVRLVLAVSAAATVLLAATRDPVVFGGATAVGGWVAVTWNVTTVTLRQEIVPDALLGRVSSVVRLLAYGSMPLGAAAGGFVADAFGIAAPFWTAAAGTAVLAVAVAALVDDRGIGAARAAAGVPAAAAEGEPR